MLNLVPQDDLPTNNEVPQDDLPLIQEVANRPADFQEIANSPDPYTFSPSTVAVAGLIGTVAGGLYTKLFKTGGSLLLSALAGGVSGAGSSATGEIVREATNNSNVGQLVALGTEIASGAALPLARDLVTRVPPAAIMAALGYAKAKSAQAITGESASSRLAKDKIFGKDVLKPGVATFSYRDAFEDVTSLELAQTLGVTVPKGMKTQDAIRNALYDTMTEKAKTAPIKSTPVYKQLLKDLMQGVKDGVVKGDDVKAIARLINGQTSPNAKTASTFNARLLNTAQQAVKEYDGVNVSKDAADLLKEAIDSYIGMPYYSTLKATEKQRFTAEALDDIPVLLEKGIKGDTLESTLKNLSRNPEGKLNFKIALSSYLRELPEKEALSEWNRLYDSGVLIRSKVMDIGETVALARKVKLYTEKGYLRKAGDITAQALKMSLVQGILPAEGANLVSKKPQGVNEFIVKSPS